MNRTISGIVECWTLHDVSNDIKTGVCPPYQDVIPILMTALVVEDYKGRFPAGTAMRSSWLTGFNLQDMQVFTCNSVYQLKGIGFFVNGYPGRYDLEVGNAMMKIAALNGDIAPLSSRILH